jgi:hypothetical protein
MSYRRKGSRYDTIPETPRHSLQEGLTAAMVPQPFKGDLPAELAGRIGIIGEGMNPDPQTPVDWALYWARQGLHVFPVERFLGSPLVDRWHSAATHNIATIAEWWSTWPTADVAGVLDKSGRYAVVASAEQGGDVELAEVEEEFGELPAVFRFSNRWGDEHLVLRGDVMTSHHRLGQGLHVLGTGHFIYLPDSWAPVRDWK